jgi:molybdate transport system permease protein
MLDSTALSALALSLRVATIATALVALVGIPAGYLLARRKCPGRDLIDALVTLPLVLPPTVVGYYLILLLGRNGLLGALLYRWTGWSVMFTWQAAVIASFVVALPFMIKTSRAAIETVDHTLQEASYTLGHSECWTALRVTLPLARRGIAAGAVLSFARAMGEFGATLMLAGNIPGRTSTMPLGIYSAVAGGEWGRAHGLVLLFTCICALALFGANRLTRSTP